MHLFLMEPSTKPGCTIDVKVHRTGPTKSYPMALHPWKMAELTPPPAQGPDPLYRLRSQNWTFPWGPRCSMELMMGLKIALIMINCKLWCGAISGSLPTCPHCGGHEGKGCFWAPFQQELGEQATLRRTETAQSSPGAAVDLSASSQSRETAQTQLSRR